MDNKYLYYIWLSNTFSPGSPIPKLLLTHFSSIDEIYNAYEEEYEVLGLQKSDIAKLCNKDLTKAISFLNFCETEKVGILCYDEPYYPERLKIINNPPPMFYYKGRLNNLDDYPCITMVGTRSCSERGFRLAYETGYDAASKGAVIVNGLALGIDGACIAGALDANGYAIGVLGCGIDRVYPSGNKELFTRLKATGLILSEFQPFSTPDGKNFPVRNRVISGLSLACCVFEADASGSGAMITAEHALTQGRRIFAVPGKPYDKSYSGPLELIKNGATVLTEADDILSEYSMSFPHRINLANKNAPPSDKLERLVAFYFKKGTDPDTPVNRRHVPVADKDGKTKWVIEQEQQKQTDDAYKNPPPAVEKAASSNVHNRASQDLQRADSTPTSQQVKNTASASQKQAAAASCVTEKKPAPQLSENALSALGQADLQILDIVVKQGTLTADEIASHGIKIEQVLSTLTLLEVFDLIEALPGGRYKIQEA